MGKLHKPRHTKKPSPRGQSLGPVREHLHDLGCSIYEKLDKRGFHDALEADEIMASPHLRQRIENEVAEPMRRFLELWKQLYERD